MNQHTPWKRIIVGVDFSPESQLATAQGLDIARHCGAELVLVHAGSVPSPVGTGYTPAAIEELQEFLTDRFASERDELETLRESLSGQGVTVSKLLIDAAPETGLCEAASQFDASLVIVGTHGRTGIKRFLMGSVAERVVRSCVTDVMVARPVDQSAGGYRRILVATDFSPPAEQALRAALTIAANDAQVDLFHAWQMPYVGAQYYKPITMRTTLFQQFAKEVEADVRAKAEVLLTKYQRSGITLQFDTVQAPAAHAIQERSGNYDLVVTGCHGRKGLSRFILGSIAELTVRHAPCGVLVAHDAPPVL